MPRSIAIAAMVVALCCILVVACGGEKTNPWLYCTTNPCQPLGLFPEPTRAALTHDRSLAASCDYSSPGAGDGVLLWHTDWDPRTNTGRCASEKQATDLAR